MTDVTWPYEPRWYQQQLREAMHTKKRAFLLYHRRAGKDIACFNELAIRAITDTPGTYYYVLPTYSQGKKVIWKGITESGSRIIDFIPKELKSKTNIAEMNIELVNGSMIQVVGSEQYDSLRGTNPKGVVFSEYAMQDPRCWTDIISPILLKNGGFAIFNTTPMGRNHAYDLWKMAEGSKDWYTQKLTVEQTGLITQAQLDQEIAEGKSPEIIQQEYFCSFSKGLDGTYFGALLNDARDQGRICHVPVDENLPVHTAWDLGIGDSTSIIFYQLVPGGEIHFVDYYENSGEALSHYVSVLHKKNYLYADHNFPHDVKARELGTGCTREETLRKLGVKPRIGERLPLEDGIQNFRSILPRCWFDDEKCGIAVKHLDNYRKHFSDKLRCFVDRPLHDTHSHCADAFRYAAVAIVKNSGSSSMTASNAAELWNKYSGVA